MEKSNLFFIIWVGVGVLTFVLFRDILLGGSIDSARYMLSALAQAQAAIVAIVVSLTLVVVQLASQTYSPRTIRLFMKENAFWSLLLLYGISIFYDLILLKMLSAENFETLGIFINGSIFLGIVAFSALFPYTKETLEKIKPENIIGRLGKNAEIEIGGFIRDAILPVHDITLKAVKAGDSYTAIDGVKESKTLALSGLESKFKEEEKLEVIEHLSRNFIQLSNLSFTQENEGCVIEIGKALGEIGSKTIEKRWDGVPSVIVAEYKGGEKYGETGVRIFGYDMEACDYMASEVVNALGIVFPKTLEKRWSDSIECVTTSIGKIYIKAREERFPNSNLIISQLFSDVKKSLDEDVNFTILNVMGPVINILVEIMNKNLLSPWDYSETMILTKRAVKKTVDAVKEDESKRYVLIKMLEHLLNIGPRGNEKISNIVKAEILYIIEELSKDKKEENLVLITFISTIGNEGLGEEDPTKLEWIIARLRDIGNLTAKKELDELTWWVLQFLEGIGVNNVDKPDVTEQITRFIKEIGMLTVGKLFKSEERAFHSIFWIGAVTTDEKLRRKLCERINEMRGILRDDKMFEDIVKNFESTNKENISQFMEFRKLCNF